METNLAILEKKAINAALKNEWAIALELNTQIIKKRPNDLNAKIRLGKAQLNTKDFKNAVKTFKEVLKVDPINTIANKNLKIAQEERVEGNNIHTKKLIKEPGKCTEAQIYTKKKIDLTAGELLDLKVKKTSVDVLKDKKVIGTLEDKDLVRSLNKAKTEKAQLETHFIKEKQEKIIILILSTIPVFKSEKQDIKPYFKKGTIETEEPELEFEDNSEEQ